MRKVNSSVREQGTSTVPGGEKIGSESKAAYG